jgi:hypothetical protein
MTAKRRRWKNKDATANPPNPASAQPYAGSYIPSRPCRCGKSGYTERRYARAVQREMRRKGDPEADILDVYRCRLDETHWHVGHNRYGPPPNLNDPSTWEVIEDEPISVGLDDPAGPG